MPSLDHGLDIPYEVQLEHHAATSTSLMTILEPQRSPGQQATRHLLTPGVYMVSLAYNGSQEAILRHVGGGTTNRVTVPTGTAGMPRTSAPIKISVQGTTEYLNVESPSTGGTARATISVIPAPTFDEMAESAQGVSVLSEISNLKTTKADKSTLDERVPANTSLRRDTTVGTRIFAGNTMIYGDTGWRSIIDPSNFPTMTQGRILAKRTSVGVMISIDAAKFNQAGSIALPRLDLALRPRFRLRTNWYDGAAAAAGGTLNISSGGYFNLYGYSLDQEVFMDATYDTDASWPSSLPGLPI